MAVSFQGIGTGIQTDQLVAAILNQEGQSVQRMVDKQALNKLRGTALLSLRKDMSSLSTSLAGLQDKFNARTVTSTDTNGVYVSATANGASVGNYDLSVTSVATRGRLAPTMSLDVPPVPTNLSVADPAAAIFTSSRASFAVKGTDGVIKAFELTNNSLNGLRDAINASGAGVTASIVNSGTGSNPYQLVISAKETGTGTTGGVVTFAAIDNADTGGATVINAGLGITGGTLSGTFGTPTGLTGGLTNADNLAKDAVFTLNGIQLTRKSNVVSDAADGVIFTLKQGGQTGTTTLTVAQDKASATSGLQDVLSKYNALLKTYNAAATSTKDSSGAIIKGALAGDESIRSLLNQVRSALTGTISGPTGSATLTSLTNLGVSTGADGALSLNVSTFQAALDKDFSAAKNLFTFAASSTSGAVSLKEATSKTTTGSVGFSISQYQSGGAVTGTLTFNGTDYSVSGTNGTLSGPAGSPLEGLTVSVLGTGSGTLSLTRGGGQLARDLISGFSTSGTGAFSVALANLETQNKALSDQVTQGQARLARRKIVLQRQFSKMETAVASMKAAVGGLSGLG